MNASLVVKEKRNEAEIIRVKKPFPAVLDNLIITDGVNFDPIR